MTDSNAIRMISGLMQRNAATEAETAMVANVLSRYPWFVPARYAQAATAHKQKAFSAEMLSNGFPYTGNWLMFLDHITGAPLTNDTAAAVAPATFVEEIAPQLQQELVSGVVEEEQVEEIEELPLAEVELIETADERAADAAEENGHNAEKINETVIEDLIFTPVQSEDYFKQQGINVSSEFTGDINELVHGNEESEDTESDARSLMVMMSFTEWLVHFKRTTEKKNEEIEDQKAVRAMWQKEKLAAALEEENDEIPENVFEMAVNSIAKEEGLASESLAEIYLKQGKHDHAIEMYKKLSLRNPQKNAYFAARIEEILKGRQ